MRVFLAGATGRIGIRLVPLLVADGHQVAGMTRSATKTGVLRDLGATPVVCDVFDAAAVRDAVTSFATEAVMDQLTDLPDDAAELRVAGGANARIRRDGTRNLLDAAAAAGASRFVAQSVAWTLQGDAGQAVADLERMVLAVDGVVVRYGQFYGPGTYYEDELPPPPRIHIDDAAARTVPTLAMPSTTLTVVDS